MVCCYTFSACIHWLSMSLTYYFRSSNYPGTQPKPSYKKLVYCAFQVSCLEVREWHLFLSLYKLEAFVTCSITELSKHLQGTAYLRFPLDNSLAHLLNLLTHLHLYSSLFLLFLPLTLSRADNASKLHTHEIPDRLSSVVNDSSHYPSIHCPHHSSPVPNCHGNHDLLTEGGAI